MYKWVCAVRTTFLGCHHLFSHFLRCLDLTKSLNGRYHDLYIVMLRRNILVFETQKSE